MSEERLQKLLARAGLSSRRAAEELIRAGRVTVNGRPADLGAKADPERDVVKLDGRRLAPPRRRHYLLLNKPRGCLTTRSDPAGRPTVFSLIPERLRRALNAVGRLDWDSEGLLVLTDDGDFAQRLAHPSGGCRKTYAAKVKGRPDPATLDRLRAGIVLQGRRTAPARIAPMRRRERRSGEAVNSWWRVELSEGRTRQVREMFFRIGHPVLKLRRIAIGPLADSRLPLGRWRELTAVEVEALRRASRPERRETSRRRGAGGPRTENKRPKRREAKPVAPNAARGLIVAIDGPVGAGKTSVARLVAERLGIPHLETGAMYRAFGLKVLESGVDPDDRAAVEALAARRDLRLEPAGSGRIGILVDGAPLGERIREPRIGEVTSRIAAYPGLRARLVELQRRCAAERGAVVEGRDIGTQVFPDTPHKFYLEAAADVRVERRYRQLRESGRRDVSRAEVAEDVARRDHRDTHRADSPLARDTSYLTLDTSLLTTEEVVERIVGELWRTGAS